MRQYPINYDTEAFEAFKKHYGDKYPFMSFCEVQQIGCKQAWIILDKFGNKYLQSYNTIVSIYFSDAREVLHLGKWSVTTSRHQSIFSRLV